MITEIPGLRVGHWTDPAARTGCTVVLFPEGTVASGEVRGGAPATRELALLDPSRTVARIDALVLTGGSAFGLASADGVMRWCEAQGRGFATSAGPVPSVVALGLFDLMVGDASVRPGPAEGLAACEAAAAAPAGALIDLGLVGAGTGATIADGLPGGARRPGGLASASAAIGDLRVAALVAVNAFGQPGGDDEAALRFPLTGREGPGNTTIGLVATNATLDKRDCHLVAQGAHDGLARAVFPAHTRFDGDAFVAAAVGGVEADVDAVRALAVHVVARAIATFAP